MTTQQVTTFLKYANLQMAAEAFLIDQDTGANRFVGKELAAALIVGNKRNSKFSTVLADKFATDWKVIAHKVNTPTGFSGTLFECQADDSARGLKKGELVLSFRSTEFIDDAVRDNQATNKMEVRANGWAFGRIADMESWYLELNANSSMTPFEHFSITGYTLLVTPSCRAKTITTNSSPTCAVTSARYSKRSGNT